MTISRRKEFFILAHSLLIACAYLFAAPQARAAGIILSTTDKTVGTSSSFAVDVFLESSVPVNAISGSVIIPDSLGVVDMSDGNSIINLWIERPHTADNRLLFSGIIPGGFAGSHGRLLTLRIQAKKVGAAAISIDGSTRAYANTASTSEVRLTSKPLLFSVVIGKENKSPEIIDTVAPEPFNPYLAQFPDSSGKEKWAVIFATQDKGSGIHGYEVAESGALISSDDKARLSPLPWKKAESPYTLSDQGLGSFIYVKADDESGNERIEMLSPKRSWYERQKGYILTAILVALAALYALFNKKISKRSVH
jgi:hypothetical protein